MSDIVERLIEQLAVPSDVQEYGAFQKTPEIVNHSYKVGFLEGARKTSKALFERVEKAEARCAELEKALEPFADEAASTFIAKAAQAEAREAAAKIAHSVQGEMRAAKEEATSEDGRACALWAEQTASEIAAAIRSMDV